MISPPCREIVIADVDSCKHEQLLQIFLLLKTVFKDYERNVKDFAYLHFSGISSSVLCSLGAEDLLEISVVCSFYGICDIFIFLWQLFRGIFNYCVFNPFFLLDRFLVKY